ncbi:MAG TPA: glycosyl hydrolase, partial [Candidatus Acidoferrum sp.]|nr:glycosyl hydrolase [Candidatus Acidoferrum sp.]
VQLGSAQLYLGYDDTSAVTNFSLQYFSSNAWVTIPGASFAGNSATVMNVVFGSPVTASLVRLYSTDATVGVREIALFGTNGPAGYPIGTDVTLNQGKKCAVLASSIAGTNYPGLAVDGYAGTNAGWQTANVNGPHTLEVDFQAPTRIGSAHVYSGSGTYPALSAFTLNYWNGSAWTAIPGATVTGNSQRELAITFSAPVSTTKVQLSIPGNGTQFVRELAVFPASSGITSFPLWTDVVSNDPPATVWETYGDGFWSLVNAANSLALVVATNGAGQSVSNAADLTQQFQVLYNLDSDTFRLRNRAAWQCVAAQTASTSPGVAVVTEPAYHAMPQELWRFQSVGGGTYRVVNVWSGLALQTDGQSPATVTLQPPSGDARQQWQFSFRAIYPKKGVAGNEASWARIGSSWDYNWSRNPTLPAPPQVVFSPQQWNGGGMNTLPLSYPGWHTDPKPVTLLGINEPDLAGQANMSVASVVALWPQLQALDMPLVSPATSWAFGGWLSNYYYQATSTGLRNDYTGVHWYSYPTADSLVSHLQSVYSTWGKPLWLTEFASGNGGTWSEESNYTFLAEFLWRAENLPWLRRYGIFCYSQNPPTNPWDLTSPASAVFRSDGVTFTELGELYAGWDADQTIHTGVNYILHNKGACFRISNPGSASLGTATIYSTGVSVQWQLVAAPTTNHYYIVSATDSTCLSWNGSSMSLAPAGTTGGAVEWTYTPETNGYFFIDNVGTTARLSLIRLPAGGGAPTFTNLTVAARGTVNDNTRWRFIKPYQAVPLGLTATPGNAQVTLRWKAVTGATGYNVKRAAMSGGPYTTIASGITATNYTDTGLVNNAPCYYVVSALSLSGESANSVEAAVIPGGQAVNCGTTNGAAWFVADAWFSGGSTSSTTSTIDTSGVTNPAPQGVYQYNRYGNFTYTITNLTANATYWVRLHFAESYWTAPGQRTFNVTLNGVTALSSFDIYAAAGAQNKAVIREAYGTANSSGQLPIQFTTVKDNAQINGIEVLQPKPLVPTGLAAAADSAQVALTWAPCPGAASYNVYRSSASGGPYTLISASGTVTEISYSDYTAAHGTTWYYVITAVNAYGESGQSSEVSAALICATPPTPVAGNNGPIYQGMTLNLTASTIASASYNWSGPNSFASTLQNPSITAATPAASGTYSVTATVGGCTSAAGTTTVTVNPPVVLTVQSSGTNIVLNWPAGALQSATNVTGPWNTVEGANSPLTVQPTDPQRFYRVLVGE